jgi:hypothetical protein
MAGWHRQIGEALVTRGRAPDRDVVASQFSQAGDPHAAAWLTRAGERRCRTDSRTSLFGPSPPQHLRLMQSS